MKGGGCSLYFNSMSPIDWGAAIQYSKKKLGIQCDYLPDILEAYSTAFLKPTKIWGSQSLVTQWGI